MDSFGDYIYIILLVVAGLSGFLKKNKTTTVSTAPTTSKRSWEDVLKELIPIEKEPVHIESIPDPIVEKVEMLSVKSYETLDDFSELKAKRNVSHISATPKSSKEKVEIIHAHQRMLISLDTVDDARKAFIYSEIFNRKY